MSITLHRVVHHDTVRAAEISLTEEQRVIDACDHSRAKVADRDDEWTPDGSRIIGQRAVRALDELALADWFALPRRGAA